MIVQNYIFYKEKHGFEPVNLYYYARGIEHVTRCVVGQSTLFVNLFLAD